MIQYILESIKILSRIICNYFEVLFKHIFISTGDAKLVALGQMVLPSHIRMGWRLRLHVVVHALAIPMGTLWCMP